jgi:hypothetical protein
MSPQKPLQSAARLRLKFDRAGIAGTVGLPSENTISMQSPTVATPRLPRTAERPLVSAALLESVAAVAAILILAALVLAPWLEQTAEPRQSATAAAQGAADRTAAAWPPAGKETVLSGYVGAPYYYRSNVEMKRPNGTDLMLKRLGWDGDALYFPIDGGARVIRWSGPFGLMVDFLHNKAIARLGKGAHGREIENGVIEDVETAGTLKGQPAPSPLHLTDLFDRLEFTHGHNVLLLTGLARLAPLTPRVRPYFGIGAGVAVPHVEVWFADEDTKSRTHEYQYAGPAAQVMAGLELRIGRGSYYVEYKFIWASLSGALTGGRSWSLKDLKSPWLPRWLIEPFVGLTEMPGDLWRQLARWRSGEAPKEGTFSTTLSAHQLVVGAGYVWPGAAPAAP